MIKRFEGMRSKAAQLEDGRWTIGYGHTKTAREGASVVAADAEALLLYDLINVAHAVNEWVYAPLNQNQFDALVSFAFNIGLENFRRSTTLRRLNEGRPLEAALAMELWRRADFDGERIVVDALVRRRAFEKALFLKPVDAWPPAPSPVLPPKLDYDTGALTPSSVPQVLHARLEGDRAVAAREGDDKPLLPLEDHPTASELAAASVTARLEALLPEAAFSDEDAGPPALAEPEAPAAEQPFPEETTEPAERDLELPQMDEPEAHVAEAALAAFTPSVHADTATSAEAPAAKDPPIDRISPLLLMGLLFVGVVLFYSSIKWGFSPTVGGASPLLLTLLGWVSGALGIVCCAVAAYFLLVRLADRD